MNKQERVLVRTSETSHDLYVFENGAYQKTATFGQNINGLDVQVVDESYINGDEEPKSPAPIDAVTKKAKKATKVKGDDE